jgi:hypothetical protein
VSRFLESLQWIAVALWVGGLWTVGFVVAPMLFQTLADRSLAGSLAGRSFTLIAYIGLVCGGYLLLYRIGRFGVGAARQPFFWVALVMTLAVAAGEFAVQPMLADLKAQALPKPVMESAYRVRFNAWHGVASGLYVIESLLGMMLVVLQPRVVR